MRGPLRPCFAQVPAIAGGPRISKEDPSFAPSLGLDLMLIWPTNWILAHICLLGILFCFSRFPIFGRPREIRSQATSDFASHIDAVARLLSRTGDEDYARARLQHYRQIVRHESAGSNAPATPPQPAPPEFPDSEPEKKPKTD